MAKRKRPVGNGESVAARTPASPKKLKANDTFPATIQIIAGSYDRILHGVTASIPSDENEVVQFADSFLFSAHTSAIRCLALSPPSALVRGQTQKIILATGSTDERINLYHLSAHPPHSSNKPKLPSFTSNIVIENPQNKELGSLMHHSASITALHFPTRSKLISSAEDSTIAVTRTRDWSLLSTIKAPIPKPQGRPSGDTAPLGGVPAGINDFAIHPSLKLMISVGKGEKCMRLWNLVTGKKAGVLNFGREMLIEAGESRYGNGEGRKVAWGSTDAGEEFCVAFEWGVLVFGMDSKVRCKVMPQPKTKIHQVCYIPTSEDDDSTIMAISTEDGRILFYSTKPNDVIPPETDEDKVSSLPSAKLLAQLGGEIAGLSGRIKDFKVLRLEDKLENILIVTGSSDGIIRIWALSTLDLRSHNQNVKQVGTLLGACETGNRITCIEAYVMLPLPEGAEDVEEELNVEQDEKNSDVDSDSN